MISIIELTKERLEDFFEYIAIHISENGQDGSILFLPFSKAQSKLSPELKIKFEEGMNKEYGEMGWRKAWLAINSENKIVGHIDIRSNNQLNSTHRVLLGMGVDRNFRGSKIASDLLKHLIEYCISHPVISWIDLEVMTNNIPAKSLYEKMNFVQLSETKDMFRIDGVSYGYTSMTLNVEH